MTDALLVVPPLLKVVDAPLLGPAMLAGAGRARGHVVNVLDVNADWLAPHLVGAQWPRVFTGDHDRPAQILAPAQSAFELLTGGTAVRGSDHEQVLGRAEALAASAFGDFVRERLPRKAPGVVGLSVMYEGQVIAALAISRLVRTAFPSVMVVWGGAHVTALQNEIARDTRYGAWVDRFVFGYAEATWVQLLDALDAGEALPAATVSAGAGYIVAAEGDAGVAPSFNDLAAPRSRRLTLPAQTSRGCAYGRCAFCTYPAIEGRYRPLELAPTMAVIDQSARLGASVSFKDSLATPERLLMLARRVEGRVRWSACTKLHARFTTAFMDELAKGGCDTLEFGLETLDPKAQRLINKSQSADLLQRVLDAAQASSVSVVLNYITGFPGVDAVAEERWLGFVQRSVAQRPLLVAKVSLSRFELERLAPMAREPDRYGLRLGSSWPWSSLLDWTVRLNPSLVSTLR